MALGARREDVERLVLWRGMKLALAGVVPGLVLAAVMARLMRSLLFGTSAADVPRRQNTRSIPKFRSEDEEREFWSTHDSADYVDWSQAKRVSFPNLKPSTKTISPRLPQSLFEDLKVPANKRDVPYQSLLKIFLAERVEQELRLGR